MWSIGSDLFVEFPGRTSRRILHPGLIDEIRDGAIIFRPRAALALEPGQDLRIYFEHDREFRQQPASVDAVFDASEITAALRPLGQSVSAESREHYRVSTVFAGLTAGIDGEPCPLTDVSAVGFSVTSERPRRQGELVPARLEHDGAVFEGQAQIQSVTDLGGLTRFGLLCACEARSGSLQRGLQQISMAVQRAQLRRRARA